jgi:hypothetical protein
MMDTAAGGAGASHFFVAKVAIANPAPVPIMAAATAGGASSALMPMAPRACTFIALFARISLLTPSANNPGSNVPTLQRNRNSCASTMSVATAGGV